MRHWVVLFVFVVLFAVTAGGVPALAITPDDGTTASMTIESEHPLPLGLETCAAEPPDDFSDPDEDVLGWYDGYWYNEPVDIDHSDGVTEAELEAVVARAKARVEALRCLPFTEPVDVSVIDRATFLDQRGSPDPSTDTRLFENARAQALFLVNESTDAVLVDAANRGQAVLGYYSITNSEVVLISADDDTLYIDEATLSHELGHALQDQHFGFDTWFRDTRDARLAELGLIEGDVMLFQRAYEQHCENGAWAGQCLEPPERPEVQLANVGLYLLAFQPYSDGPSFIAHHYERGGWEAINEMYDSFPDSAKEIIYPQLYGSFEASMPELQDRSDDTWRLVDPTRHPPYDQVGEPSLFVSLIYPGIESDSERYVIDPDHLYNREPDGDLDPMNPYNYGHPATEGWIGDRFMAFTTTNDSVEELAYTHRIAFGDEDAAVRYLEAYASLLELRGGEPLDEYEVSERGAIYRIGEEDDYTGMYWVQQADATVTVVHAPSMGDLTAVHTDVEYREAATPTPTPVPPTPSPTPSPTPGEATPGMGMALAMFALVVSLLFTRWYTRRD